MTTSATAIAVVGQASLPNGGSIEFRCSSGDPGVDVLIYDGSLVALKVGELH